MEHRLGDVAYRALTCPARMTPDFIVIGAQRSGTSAFYYHLAEHPNFMVSPTKELNYFNDCYYKGTLWYRAHFPTFAEKRRMLAKQGRRLITGEASPDYLFNPNVPRRVATTMPHAKLIVMLRDPVERAYSHYRLYLRIGKERRPFEEAIASDERRTRAAEREEARSGRPSGFYHGYDSYLGRSRYADQLEPWLRLFPWEQFLFLRSEDFYADPAAVLRQALGFLGAPADGLPERLTYARYDGHSVRPGESGATGMSGALREHLRAYFAPHNTRLYALLGREMGWSGAA